MRLLDTIGRVLFSAAIRRALWRSPKAALIVAGIVGLLLMFAASIPARAQNPTGNQAGTYDTRPQARSACGAYAASLPGVNFPAGTPTRCVQDSPQERYRVDYFSPSQERWMNTEHGYWHWREGCPLDSPWSEEHGTCGTPNTCSSEPNKPPSSYTNINTSDSSICTGGCKFESLGILLTSTVDGKTQHNSTGGWAPTGAQCSTTGAGVSAPAPADSDGDGTSDGFDGSPNNPGSGGGGGEDGAQQSEDAHCGKPGQPECGEKGSGSGNGNTSGGGGSCASPPSSTGDPILAQIAFQAWATRCAVEGLGKGTVPGNGDGDGNGGDQPDWTKGNGPAVEADGTDYVAESKRFGLGISPSMLDTQNLFGNGTCPQFTITMLGASISTAEFAPWCQIAAVMRTLILLFGTFTALGILMGRGLV